MIRARWQQSRLNLWAWLERLEDVMVQHMIDISEHDSRLDDLDKRIRRFETMQFGYGPPPSSGSIRISSYDPQRKES